MQSNTARYIPLLSWLILILSFAVLAFNQYAYRFPGNNYFPENIIFYLVILVLINLGLVLHFGKNSKANLMGVELLYFFGVMSLVALATNAVQLTPFNTIDHHIVALETKAHINLKALMEWTNQYPYFKNTLTFIYNSLPYQMCFIPLFIIAMGKFNLLKDYYFLTLTTVLIGFTFYYFFPTTAPASVINSALFLPEQLATGLKFNDIHNHIKPNTLEGGLIALPSFHAIWAFLCVYLLKEWIVPCAILLIINVLLIVSCVLLGWHYPTDILGALIVLYLSFYLHRAVNNTNRRTNRN